MNTQLIDTCMYPLQWRHTICLERAGGTEGLSQWSPVPEARLLKLNVKYTCKDKIQLEFDAIYMCTCTVLSKALGN